MSEDTLVKQASYQVNPEGTSGKVRLNIKGETVIADPIQQMIVDGRVFMISNQAMETARDIGNTAYTETEPAIAIDVPLGTTFIPLEIMLYQGGAVATADITALFTVDTVARITSGNALTPRNFLINSAQPNTSLVTAKCHDEGTTALITAAPTNDITFLAKLQAEALVGGDDQDIHWSAREFIPPIIKGPGSLVIYWYGTGNPEGFYHIVWAEIPTVNAVP